MKRDLVKNVGVAGGCRTSKLSCSLGWDECGGSDPAAGTERKLSSRAVAKGGGHKRQQLCQQWAAETRLQEGSALAGKHPDVSLGGAWMCRQPLWWGCGGGDQTPALRQGKGRGLPSLRRSCWNKGNGS